MEREGKEKKTRCEAGRRIVVRTAPANAGLVSRCGRRCQNVRRQIPSLPLPNDVTRRDRRLGRCIGADQRQYHRPVTHSGKFRRVSTHRLGPNHAAGQPKAEREGRRRLTARSGRNKSNGHPTHDLTRRQFQKIHCARTHRHDLYSIAGRTDNKQQREKRGGKQTTNHMSSTLPSS